MHHPTDRITHTTAFVTPVMRIKLEHLSSGMVIRKCFFYISFKKQQQNPPLFTNLFLILFTYLFIYLFILYAAMVVSGVLKRESLLPSPF